MAVRKFEVWLDEYEGDEEWELDTLTLSSALGYRFTVDRVVEIDE
jgi:hypothetical protein